MELSNRESSSSWTPFLNGLKTQEDASTGHIVFWHQEGLWAVPFDAARRTLTGPAAQVIEELRVNAGGLAHFALARNGSLVYWTDAGAAVRVWKRLGVVVRAWRDPPRGRLRVAF